MVLPANMPIIRAVHQIYITNNYARVTSRTANYGSAVTPIIVYNISHYLYFEALAPLSLAPVLDCNRWRDYHVDTRSYMDRKL